MDIKKNFDQLPLSTKRTMGLGLTLALLVALPLFVWTAINVNFNANKRAQGEPNFCGGTCGSNYNCQANFFCYEGYCRNPICADKTDCVCNTTTPLPTIAATSATAKSLATQLATVIPNPTATTSALPKGGDENYGLLTVETPKSGEQTPPSITQNQPIENQFVNKYAMYIFVGFVVLVVTALYFMFKKPKVTNIPQILPPTNI